MSDRSFRDHVARLLDWADAHASFDSAVDALPARLRGMQPEQVPYSPWQLVEHLRITQHDILDFCRNPEYREMKWPDDYWPVSKAPASDQAWAESLRRFGEDRNALRAMALNPEVQLEANIPHGDGQTYLRELLLVADHSAYHVGQLIVVRRLLGDWPPGNG
jgi:hypothetical protein